MKSAETIKDYCERRIGELKEADREFCADRWGTGIDPNKKMLAREMSNQVTFARQELQVVLKLVEEAYAQQSATVEGEDEDDVIETYAKSQAKEFGIKGWDAKIFKDGIRNGYTKAMSESTQPAKEESERGITVHPPNTTAPYDKEESPAPPEHQQEDRLYMVITPEDKILASFIYESWAKEWRDEYSLTSEIVPYSVSENNYNNIRFPHH